MQNTTSVNTRTFSKGMVKDFNDTYTGEGTWTHARNAVNNSEYGDLGVLGNEPANLKCANIPYTVIGTIYVGDGRWVVFSGNGYRASSKINIAPIDPVTGIPVSSDFASEIGLFDENNCTYKTMVNDTTSSCKLRFDQQYPIIGVSKTNADCTVQLYWDDGYNPSRTMNIGDPDVWADFKINITANPPLHWPGVPYVQKDIDNDPDCKTLVDTKDIDCDKLRLALLTDTPCITVAKGTGLGTLPNGSYQATIAYTVNGSRVTDYLSFSNLQPIWSHNNQEGTIDIFFDNLDSDYDEFELVVISSVNQQTVCKRIGVYSVNTKKVSLDAINADLPSVPIEQIPISNPAFEKSEAMYKVNNYLIRVAPTTEFNFNYQPLANNIEVKWVATKYPADYYYKGGNKPSFMRDEVYSFFIRWVYRTGQKSPSFHIPGRAAEPSRDLYTIVSPDGANPDGTGTPRWKVDSTAYITDYINEKLDDGGTALLKGKMGYWQSTEKYPDNKPEIWGDLCGKNIRHHKMPEDFIFGNTFGSRDRVSPQSLPLFDDRDNTITILGVEFNNIALPRDNDQLGISNLVGYEILVGSREGHRTILAKGLINNMREYDIPSDISNRKGLYVNYPYNYTGEDPTLGIDNRYSNKDYKQTRGNARDSDFIGLSGVSRDKFSFHSPETTFRNPFLSVTELKLYGEVSAQVKGRFKPMEGHPKHKLITNAAFALASISGVAVGITASNTNNLDILDAPLTVAAGAVIGAVMGGTIGGGIGSAIGSIAGGVAGLAFWAFDRFATFSYFFIEATDSLLAAIKGFSSYEQYVLQYMSHGFYNDMVALPVDERRRIITDSIYVQPSIVDFTRNYRVNNINRSKTVVLETAAPLSTERQLHPNRLDDTLFTLKTKAPRFSRDDREDMYNDPSSRIFKSVSYAKYGALKVNNDNQYGQLEQIKQLPVGCIQLISLNNGGYLFTKLTSDYLFGGDVYINRYTEKNTFYYFNNWMENLPDGTEWNYRSYNNIPYPRYWMDTSTFSASDLYTSLLTFEVTAKGLPSSKHNLDRYGNSSLLKVKRAYMYLFNSGVRDFYVESEINLALRDYSEGPGERHYDFHTNTDYEEMFRMESIRFNNYYKYDFSLSKSKFFSYFISWANLQSRYYDPLTAELCYDYYPNRVIYSLPQQQEALKDNWRTFLANNYNDFRSRVTAMRSVKGTGSIIMLEEESPIIIQGVEQIDLNSGTKLTIGDGGLFNGQPLQNIVNADKELEYGSCQSRLSVINTPAGVFYINTDQGRVFSFSSGLEDISKAGMKWWFQEYTPFKILEDFPNYELTDNTIVGVGCQTVYDNDNEVVYFTKRDFKLLPSKKDKLTYKGNGIFNDGSKEVFTGDSRYFEDASWTASYDVKTKAWISFHDWHPNFSLSGRNTFFTVKNVKSKSSIWKHNDRCDLYSNFYNTNYPFEIEYVQNQGQEVTTTRNVEYALECYKYDDECYDKYHLLTENFDEAIIHNSEQISGQLNLTLSPQSAYAQLSYPIVNLNSIDVLYSKVEQKYRFNQFWDITNDRAVQIPMWDTEANGYIRNINPSYVNYNKGATERKKFRHYINKVLLRKVVSGSSKFLFKIINNKLLKSFR